MGSRQLVKVEREPMSREVERQLSTLFGYFNDLENSADGVLELIPLLPDEMLLETRRYARTLGHVGWRVEVAADAEILQRIQSRALSGKRDEAREGKMAAYENAAKIAGCHEDTIRRNVQIYKTFLAPDVPEPVLTAQQRLREKGYCEAALRAEHPQEAIVEFAAKKAADFRFTTWDARKAAKAGNPQKERQKVLPAIDKFLLDAEKEEAWKAWLGVTAILRKEIPPLRNVLHEAIRGCREQLARPEETLEERLLAFLREGPGPTCELLADQLLEDRYKVQGVLDSLVADGTIRAKKQSDDKTKITSARGATPMIYFFNYTVIGEGDRDMYFTDDDDEN